MSNANYVFKRKEPTTLMQYFRLVFSASTLGFGGFGAGGQLPEFTTSYFMPSWFICFRLEQGYTNLPYKKIQYENTLNIFPLF